MIVIHEVLFHIHRNGFFSEMRMLIETTAIVTPQSCRRSVRLLIQLDRIKNTFLTAISP